MIFGSDDYRAILRQELVSRIRSNPQYSLRAFARSIHLDHSMLSHVLNGKKKLSEGRAYEVAQYLGFSGPEMDYFVSLVRLDHSENELQRRRLLQEIENKFPGKISERQVLSLDEFNMISNWYHFAILQLFRLPRFKCDSADDESRIAVRFGINIFEVRAALERLERLGMIRRTASGSYTRIESGVVFRTDMKTEALTELYGQTIEKTKDALRQRPASERVAGGDVVALSSKSLAAARALAEEFYERLSHLSVKDTDRDRIYYFSIHGIPLDVENFAEAVRSN